MQQWENESEVDNFEPSSHDSSCIGKESFAQTHQLRLASLVQRLTEDSCFQC